MRRTEWLQETRMLRFEEALDAWTERRLTQEEAARLLGVCARTFRRYVDRHEEAGVDGLVDRRLSQLSALRAPIPGLPMHRDGSTHEWVRGSCWDLIVTMDDATSEVYSGFFVDEEGTWSTLRGVRETLESRGLSAGKYTDRGSHYWHTPKAGGKVDKAAPTQVGRAMGELGIEMIASYSARGARVSAGVVPAAHQPALRIAGGGAGKRLRAAAGRGAGRHRCA